jgi:D-alanine transaminase
MILVNDRFVERTEATVDIEDRGYQFGDGVYEVIRVYGGAPFLLDEHMARLARSLREIRLEPPYGIDELTDKIRRLITLNALGDGIVYLQITRGVSPRTHGFPKNAHSVLTAYTQTLDRPLQALQEGIRAHLTEDIRWLRCDIKSLNLLGSVLAKQEALDKGCAEAILHRGKTVTEGSASNVFALIGGVWFTHPANHLILDGITRRSVLRIMQELDMPAKEEAVTVEQLLAAEELIVTSTTQEVMPVVAVDGRPIGDGSVGPWTRRLQEAFEAAIRETANRPS